MASLYDLKNPGLVWFEGKSLDKTIDTVRDVTALVRTAGAALPFNEDQRLAALYCYKVLDTGAEQAYDDLTTLASAVCKAPVALISLTDQNRQWFKSKVGLEATEIPRDLAFCAHAILQPDMVFEVQDALLDPRFSDNPLVTGEGGVRFYAGAPLVTTDGLPIGTVCVIDHAPRSLSSNERKALQSLARQVVAQLELRRALAGLEIESITDPLTALWNRRGLERQFNTAWEVHVQHRTPISVLMLDLDHFKNINDAFGHPAGDQVLVQVAGLIGDSVGRNDTVARFGGEEFCVVLPNAGAVEAQICAEALRVAFEQAEWAIAPVTVSIGVATALEDGNDSSSLLLTRADAALYSAKKDGRNRVRQFEGWHQ